MYRRGLLCIALICLSLTTTSAIKCYLGTDQQCILGPDMNDCGEGEDCQCAKYRFPCTEDDHACNKQEQENHTKKWAYTIVSARTCQALESATDLFEQVSCCSTDGCNQPTSGKCFMAQSRRRALRKWADLLDF